MPVIRVNSLSDFQEDLRWPLLADPYFVDVPVIDFRKSEVETEIQRSLGTVTTRSGKCGACVVVMPMSIVDEFTDASAAHPLRCKITFLVLEVPILNMNATQGTGKSALSICERIRQVMKHRIFGGFSNCLTPADPTFQAVEDPIAPVAWEAHFETFVGVDQAVDLHFQRVDTPQVVYDDILGQLTLSCPNTPDPTIYYTLDGSYPYTSALDPNPSAVLYTGPITMTGEWVLRAAGYADGWLPSNVAFIRSTDISAMGSGGGELGGLP